MTTPSKTFSLGGKPSALPIAVPSTRASYSAANSPEEARHRSQSVVSLIVRLELMIRTEVPVIQRIRLMHSLEPQILRAASGIAKPVVRPRQESGGGPTLEQRLYGLSVSNLKQALEDLDRSPEAYTEAAAGQRQWLVRHLLRFFGRALEYCVRWNLPWPPRLWGELHETFFYLIAREHLRLGQPPGEAFDPELEYKRLLLLGLLQEQASARDLPLDRLRDWAAASRLSRPAAFSGAFGIYVVEVYRDRPPREQASPLEPGFNGWVLEPAAAFADWLNLPRGVGV
jgi:hypothetical protein